MESLTAWARKFGMPREADAIRGNQYIQIDWLSGCAGLVRAEKCVFACNEKVVAEIWAVSGQYRRSPDWGKCKCRAIWGTFSGEATVCLRI